MDRFFLRPEEPNLAAFESKLDEVLELYSAATNHRVGFGDCRRFEYTPAKGYTARTIIPVICDGDRIGELYVLLFKPGEGTGDEGTYSLTEVRFSKSLNPRNSGIESIPRKKRCQTEVFLPFGTATSSAIYEGVVCLDLLTLDIFSKIVVKDRELGLSRAKWRRKLLEGKRVAPYADFTTGYSEPYGYRFGDPHAVRFSCGEVNPVIQMVGFLELSLGTEAHKVFQELESRRPQ